VVELSSWGKKITNIERQKVTFTGWGSTLAPKKGESATMGMKRAKKRKRRDRTASGLPALRALEINTYK
jgi:hypothetical protein